MESSICIATYNSLKTLLEQLEALQSCRDPINSEIVIADNGSTDGTFEYLSNHKNGQVTIIQASAKRGAGYTRNRAVDVARGSKILFCDADDLVMPTWYAAHLQVLENHQVSVGFQIPFSGLHSPSGETDTARKPPYITFNNQDIPIACSGNMGISRHLFSQLGGFNEDLMRGEDIDFTIRLIQRRVIATLAEDAVILRRERTSNAAIYGQFFANGFASRNLSDQYPGLTNQRPDRTFLVTRLPYLFTRGSRRKSWLKAWAHYRGWNSGSDSN